MLAEAYVKYNHYIYKSATLPTLTSETMLEIVNCSWLTRSLDEDLYSLKNVLTVLNFYNIHTNQEEHRQHVNMDTKLANSFREE